MKAKEILDMYLKNTGDMSQRKVADVLGWSPSTLSMVLAGTYANVEQKEAEMAEKLLGIKADKLIEEFKPIQITEKIVGTPDLMAVYSLCNGLVARDSSLTASIGLVIGDAGMGKTTAVQSFAAENSAASYVLYMGFNRNALFREIAEAVVGRSARSYYDNLQLIMGATRVYRKLIIVDEADRMPISMLEDLRTLNEYGRVPLLLVGEPKLAATIKKADRIESRIRKPRITFSPVKNETIGTLYEDCCGLILTGEMTNTLARMAHRDFRVAVNDMQNLIRLMNINHKKKLTQSIIDLYKSGQELLNENK